MKQMMIWRGFRWMVCARDRLAYVQNVLAEDFHTTDFYSLDIKYLETLDSQLQEASPVIEQGKETLAYAKMGFLDFHGVLDIGCGNGTFLDIARQNGFPVFGIDINPEAVKATESNGIGAALVKDVTRESLGGLKRPLLITLRQAIEHVGNIKK